MNDVSRSELESRLVAVLAAFSFVFPLLVFVTIPWSHVIWKRSRGSLGVAGRWLSFVSLCLWAVVLIVGAFLMVAL